VNDTYGHEAGDRLLKSVSTRLLEQVRPGDTVGRLAGDEFVVLCENLEQPNTVAGIAERINVELRKPTEFEHTPLFVTASIGIAIGHGGTHSADDLLRSADTAMYAVKEKGRDGWQFFNSSLQDQAQKRLAVTQGLRTAIQNNELSPRFQPIVSAKDGHIVGAELLLRWHPSSGEVSPAVFIPIAESTSSIIAIGAWVFRRGCEAEADWRKRWGERAPSYISINVSTRQLSEPNLADEFAAILRETGADPARIMIEITETSLMADVETNLRVLRQLANLGLSVAVDDFGTGYSSLAQLTRMPVGVLKIDKAFIDGIENSAESRTIVRAVIGLGRALGMKLVAEGVENEAQLLELRGHGCDLIQGYLFHRPLDEPTFIKTVTNELERSLKIDHQSLFFLLYISQANTEMDEQSLMQIIKVSRENNQPVGLTGCLLYQDGYFMQLLEGRREDVLKLMERVSLDPRHKNVQIVAQGNEQRRLFVDWSMGFQDMSRIEHEPDFSAWRKRTISFAELSEDARACYAFMSGFRGN
jgi:diguanylate cyclase (GGDEF)-like protein